MTTAEKIAEQLSNDGQIFETADGASLDDLCRAANGRQEWRDGYRTGDHYKWIFGDSSVIMVCCGCWDLGYVDCWCWDGEGHTDKCSLLDS